MTVRRKPPRAALSEAVAAMNRARAGQPLSEAQLAQRRAAAAARGNVGAKPRTTEVAWRNALMAAAGLVRKMALAGLHGLHPAEVIVLMESTAREIEALPYPQKKST